MAEEYYDKLDDILRRVDVSKRFYDPDALAPVSSGEIISFGELQETTVMDEYDAPGFNYDVLEKNAEEMAPDAMNLEDLSSSKGMVARLERLERLKKDVVTHRPRAFVKEPDVAKLL